MKPFVVVLGLLALVATPAFAKTDAAKPPSCTAQWKAMSDSDKKATTYKAFMANCKTSSTAAPASTMAAPASAAPANAGTSRMASCAAAWKAMSPAQKKTTTYKDYSKTCLSGSSSATATPAAAPAMAPAATPTMARKAPKAPTAAMSGGSAPAGATGKCKDGTFTMSKTHSGACSHHGGVASWM